MNRSCKALLGAALLCGTAIQADDVFGRSFFNQRSQGSNWARWTAGQAHHLYLPDTECINGSLAIIPEYTRTFRSKKIAEYLFFNGTDTMTFGPAAATGTDIWSQQFFLNPDFVGTVQARPRVENFILDLNFYLGLDEWAQGLFFRVDVPINWTRWDLRLKEVDTNAGTVIPINRFGNAAAAPSPVTSIIQAWNGQTLNPTTFTLLQDPLAYARVDGRHSKTSVADITFLLGYNFWLTECSHFGINFAVIAPTGTRPNAKFFFEPIVGNGKHVEVGGGLTGHYEFWNNGCDQSFGVYMEGNVYHMFRAKQRRTFDLTNNGIGSRYLMFKRFGNGIASVPTQIVFGPNVTTLHCKVKNDVHGDAALMFDYKKAGFTFDIGYNVWGRTKDKITLTEDIVAGTYGIQGDQLSNNLLTASTTRINGANATVADATTVTITTADINVNSAAHPGAISHKLFTHFGYTWEHCDYLPFLGIGGEVEFDGNDGRAFNQWGIWVKGGFTFA